MTDFVRTLIRPIADNNPVAVQLLGICSALAVTKSVATALAMSVALGGVLIVSSALISLLRKVIPHNTRVVLQITIVATLVIVTDQLLAAFAPQISSQLSIFVSLIITNCIVLGRAEGFAMSHSVGESVADAIGNTLGYALLLTAIGAVRELFGAGSLLGFTLLPLAKNGGWFEPLQFLDRAPAGFFLIAGAVWVLDWMSRRAPPAVQRPGGEKG